MPQKTLTYLSPADLKPYEKNPRINDGAVEAVKRSLVEFGFQNPIIADKKLNVIAGHTRLKAAQALGLSEVPVLIADQLTPAQIKAYRIADNQTGNIAKWDFELLPLEIAELEADGFDVTLLGFPDDELGRITQTENEGLTDPDEIPEAPEAITKPGDLWLLGEHRLLCGDSTKAEDVARVMGGKRAEMMFTDPPYGVDYEGGHFHSGDVNIKRHREKLASDLNADIYKKFLPVCLPAVDGPCYLWFADSRALPVYQAVHDCGGVISALLIWHKTNAKYAAMNAQYKQRHEPLLYFKPKGSTLRWEGPSDACTLWEFKRDSKNDLHPTQKPVALAVNAIKNHKVVIVADFFAGSGSTFIAAEQLNRKCYGLEISPQYCDVICKRWEQFTGKKAVLEKV